MQDRMTEDKPTRVPARANRWWNQPSAIGLGGTEGLTGVLGDRAKSVLLLGRAPTDWKAGCGRSARPVWEGGGAHRAPPILILGRRATGSRVSSRPPPVPEGRPRIARRFNAGSEAGRTQVPTGTTEKAILPRKPCLRRPVTPHSAFEWLCNALWSCDLSNSSR